jgi:hypothetical protein
MKPSHSARAGLTIALVVGGLSIPVSAQPYTTPHKWTEYVGAQNAASNAIVDNPGWAKTSRGMPDNAFKNAAVGSQYDFCGWIDDWILDPVNNRNANLGKIELDPGVFDDFIKNYDTIYGGTGPQSAELTEVAVDTAPADGIYDAVKREDYVLAPFMGRDAVNWRNEVKIRCTQFLNRMKQLKDDGHAVKTLYYQLGNEITTNQYSYAYDEWAKSKMTSAELMAYNNTRGPYVTGPDQPGDQAYIPYFVEYAVVPFIEGIKMANDDFAAANPGSQYAALRIKPMIGPVATASNDFSRAWLNALLNYTTSNASVIGLLASRVAPGNPYGLRNKKVYELGIEVISLNHFFVGEKHDDAARDLIPDGYSWYHAYETLRNQWFNPKPAGSTINSMWGTEEAGSRYAWRGQGAQMALRVFARNMSYNLYKGITPTQNRFALYAWSLSGNLTGYGPYGGQSPNWAATDDCAHFKGFVVKPNNWVQLGLIPNCDTNDTSNACPQSNYTAELFGRYFRPGYYNGTLAVDGSSNLLPPDPTSTVTVAGETYYYADKWGTAMHYPMQVLLNHFGDVQLESFRDTTPAHTTSDIVEIYSQYTNATNNTRCKSYHEAYMFQDHPNKNRRALIVLPQHEHINTKPPLPYGNTEPNYKFKRIVVKRQGWAAVPTNVTVYMFGNRYDVSGANRRVLKLTSADFTVSRDTTADTFTFDLNTALDLSPRAKHKAPTVSDPGEPAVDLASVLITFNKGAN